MFFVDDETEPSAEPALAYREAEQVALEDDQGAAAVGESPPPEISPRASDLIVQHETGGRAYYERVIRSRPVWPGAQSGVTIGFGYDVGYVDRAKLRHDWAVLGAAALDRLEAACGVTGVAAKALAGSLKDIVVSWDAGEAVFRSVTLPEFRTLTARRLPNCDRLHPHAFGALVSLTFNRGASYDKTGDRYREMRAIKVAMQTMAFASIPGEIRAMTRIWVGSDIEAEMTRRRRNEAQLFADGLRARPVGGTPQAAAAELEEVSEGPTDEDDWDDPAPDTEAPGVAEGPNGARWAADRDSEDYAHLGDLQTGVQFTLSSEHLERLCALNDFPAAEQDRPVLFGLRGCAIVSGEDAGFQKAVTLMDQRPDHRTTRCVMGVWDRASGRVAVYPGSTVPNEAAVANWRAHRTAGNILPSGAYSYIVGAHNGKPGCFLLRRTESDRWRVVVRRSADDLCYEQTDVVDPCTPGDNIHPAFYKAPAFSSLGCQVVAGAATPGGVHSGPWSRFRQNAGLTTASGPAGRYLYVLVTAAEARLVAAGADVRRIRQGSRGERVRRLQTQLGLADPDGAFGVNTAIAWRRHQEALSGGRSDGVYTPALDARLGWAVFD